MSSSVEESMDYPELLISAYSMLNKLHTFEMIYTEMCKLETISDDQLITIMMQKSRIKMMRAWMSVRGIKLGFDKKDERQLAEAIVPGIFDISAKSVYYSGTLEQVYDSIMKFPDSWVLARPILSEMWYDIEVVDYFTIVSSTNGRKDMLKQIRRGIEDGRIYVA